jgi:hypothetical protein
MQLLLLLQYVLCRRTVSWSDERLTVYGRGRQTTARVPSVARGTIFNGTLSELKYNNYDLEKNLIFNSTEA